MKIITWPGLQCASGVGLAGKFLIASVVWKKDSSEAFFEIISWWKSSQAVIFLCQFPFYLPKDRLTFTVRE